MTAFEKATGLRLVISSHATRPVIVDRTWRERLFSWPWRPWAGTRWEERPASYMAEEPGIFLCHPALKREWDLHLLEEEVKQHDDAF